MKNWIINNKLYMVGAILGAMVGFLYWKYVGCITGTCAITLSPVRSTLYFGFFGAIFLGMFKKKPERSLEPDEKVSVN